MSRFRHLYKFHTASPRRVVDEDVIVSLKQYSKLDKKQKLKLLERIKFFEKKLEEWKALAFARGIMNRYTMARSDMNIYRELVMLFNETFRQDPDMKKELNGINIDHLFRDAEVGPYRYIAPRNHFN